MLLITAGLHGIIEFMLRKTATLVAVGSFLIALAQPSAAIAPMAARKCTDGLMLKFGQTCQYAGVSVTVGKPRGFTLSQTGLCRGKYKFKYPIVVKNGSRKVAKFSSVIVNASSARGDGDKCFDSAQSIAGEPNSALLPGRQIGFYEAFGFATKSGISVQIDVDFFGSWSAPTVYWV